MLAHWFWDRRSEILDKQVQEQPFVSTTDQTAVPLIAFLLINATCSVVLHVCGRAHSADSGQLSAGAEQAVLQHVPLLDQTLNGRSIGAALFTQLLTGGQQGRFQCMLPWQTRTQKHLLIPAHVSPRKNTIKNTSGRTFSLCSCCSFSSCILTALSCSHSLLSLVWHTKTQTHMDTTSSSVTTVRFITGYVRLTSMSGSSVRGIKEPSL